MIRPSRVPTFSRFYSSGKGKLDLNDKLNKILADSNANTPSALNDIKKKRTGVNIQNKNNQSRQGSQTLFNKNESNVGQQRFRKPKASLDTKRNLSPIDSLTPKNYNPATFKWTIGANELDNEYTTSKIKEVFNVNPKLRVMHYTDSGVREDSLRHFIKNLGPEDSFDIVNVQAIDNAQVPFLRIISKEVTLKNYNEKLAQEKSKLYGRTREKKRESGIKYIKISWSISQHDLENQKRAEIESHLKKEQTILILIDTKENLGNKNTTFTIEEPQDPDYHPPRLAELEEIRRQKILEHLKSFFDADFQAEGDIRSKYLITIKAKTSKKASKEEKKTQQNQKKLERQLRQQQREAEKKAKFEAKKKEFEQLTSNV